MIGGLLQSRDVGHVSASVMEPKRPADADSPLVFPDRGSRDSGALRPLSYARAVKMFTRARPAGIRTPWATPARLPPHPCHSIGRAHSLTLQKAWATPPRVQPDLTRSPSPPWWPITTGRCGPGPAPDCIILDCRADLGRRTGATSVPPRDALDAATVLVRIPLLRARPGHPPRLTANQKSATSAVFKAAWPKMAGWFAARWSSESVGSGSDA